MLLVMNTNFIPVQIFMFFLGGVINLAYLKTVKNANALACAVLQLLVVLAGVATLVNGWSADLVFGMLASYFTYDAIHSLGMFLKYKSVIDAVFVLHHFTGVYAMNIITRDVADIGIYTVVFITCIEFSNFLRNTSDGFQVSWPRPILHYTWPFTKLVGPFYTTVQMFKGMPEKHYNSALFTALVFGVLTLGDTYNTYQEYLESKSSVGNINESSENSRKVE